MELFYSVYYLLREDWRLLVNFWRHWKTSWNKQRQESRSQMMTFPQLLLLRPQRPPLPLHCRRLYRFRRSRLDRHHPCRRQHQLSEPQYQCNRHLGMLCQSHLWTLPVLQLVQLLSQCQCQLHRTDRRWMQKVCGCCVRCCLLKSINGEIDDSLSELCFCAVY